jgi:hypothetical protein
MNSRNLLQNNLCQVDMPSNFAVPGCLLNLYI